jgi:uncharacterized phage protein (TIGR02218 family)
VPNIFDGECTSVALCWRLERADGAGLTLTTFDAPLLRDGILHDPQPGMVPAAITRQLGLEPHSSEVGGTLTSDAISAQDLTLGRWDRARVGLSAADWQNNNAGTSDLFAGELGIIQSGDDEFSAELIGAAAKLDRPVCPATSRECRAELGDRQCRVDLAGRTIRADVLGVEGNALELNVALDERYLLGRLRFQTGPNCGLSTVITAVNGSTVYMRDLPRGSIEPGGEVELREGCDKSLETCAARFENAVNFRGEPHLPGNDVLTRFPGV